MRIWFQGRDDRISCLERVLKALEVIRLAVVEARKRADVEYDGFLWHFNAVLVRNTFRLDEAEVGRAVVAEFFYVHDAFLIIYIPT